MLIERQSERQCTIAVRDEDVRLMRKKSSSALLHVYVSEWGANDIGRASYRWSCDENNYKNRNESTLDG